MESPIRFQVQEFTRLHLLELLVPLVPGLILTTGLTLVNGPIAGRFWAMPLGYKSRLGLALALAYVLGLAVMAVTQFLNSVSMKLLWRPGTALPWVNPYWRQVATDYLGLDLVPKAELETAKELDLFVQYVINLGQQKSLKMRSWADLDKGLKRLQQAFEQYRAVETLTSQQAEKNESAAADAAVKASSLLESGKRQLAEAAIGIRPIAEDNGWLTLHHALALLEAPKSPYSAFSLLTASMQAAGAVAIAILVLSKQINSLVLAFWILVVCSTTYGLWLDFKMNTFFRSLNSGQVAVMISELRGSSRQNKSN